MKNDVLKRWTCDDSAELYGIRDWGLGYFDISPDGDVIVRPGGLNSPVGVSLMDLVRGLKDRDMSPPVLIRFSDIIASRIQEINSSFAEAMKASGYHGQYRGVYPTKVNQEREVLEDILRAGRPYHHGLEAGSKAELIAAIAHSDDPEALIICNGYKDEEFIDLALYALQLGLQTIIVIEMPDELSLVLQRAQRMSVRPRLGVRAKLFSRAGGHWDSSGGDRSKFGLDAAQIIEMVDNLRHCKMLDCLEMFHYHLGSQISDIRKIRFALGEACAFYADLIAEGARMGYINIGGGLGVDYDGSHTNFACSTNYTMREYAADVVEVISDSLGRSGIPHPTIVSESGRATVAHHSVLIFDVLHVRRFAPLAVPPVLPAGSHEMLENLLLAMNSLTARNTQEVYNDAVYYRDEVRSLFLHGDITLRERALAESIFWRLVCRIAEIVRDGKYVPEDMQDLEPAIADVYYGNFSVFQSLPDSWAIDQLFPVMPIHRLCERPSNQAVIADITCDSDGKLDKFIDLRDVKRVLPLHDVGSEQYYLGAFLLGAYQETLGDMHNLLGDTNVIHVRIKPDGGVECVNEIAGDSVEDVLRYVEFDTQKIVERVRALADRAEQSGRIGRERKEEAVRAYEAGMKGYTYFEK